MADSPIRVTMVDDDEDDFLIVRDLLRDAGPGRYDLTWVPEYARALHRACEADVDVVLADYRLGNHNGIQLVRDLLARGCKAPVILLTGQGDREIDYAAMEAG